MDAHRMDGHGRQGMTRRRRVAAKPFEDLDASGPATSGLDQFSSGIYNSFKRS